MLTSLRIQNFRSIRDASVKLGQVNLFIGPNNSGKSNFLKGVEFAAKRLASDASFNTNIFNQVLNKKPIISVEKVPYYNESTEKIYIKFELSFSYKHEGITPTNTLIFSSNGDFDLSHTHVVSDIGNNQWNALVNTERSALARETPYLAKNLLYNSIIYKPDPAKFTGSSTLFFTEIPSSDLNNILVFLFNLSQNHAKLFQQLNTDFFNCVNTLTRVSTPADPINAGLLKLKFFDKQENSYWVDEVSEGVLYFLALLCIIHQPDPPKLLLLEEPEKGIHPRRIREVMDFIFELAELRGIQIILTSHSPYVVDHFADIPECISVFDRDPETGETLIKNAGDLITETNEKLVAEGKKPIRFTDGLGEHWVSGFLGGVPLDAVVGRAI